MSFRLFLLIVAGLLFAAPGIAQATVHVCACEPEWAALAEEIGGEHIKA